MKLTEKELLDLREQLSSLEHDQWIHWSKGIYAENISSNTRRRWVKYWVPYEDLPEDIKPIDRMFADGVIELLKSKGFLEII